MQNKYLDFRIEFYDRNTLSVRHRTVRIKSSKIGRLRDSLQQQLRNRGFRDIEILEWERLTIIF